MGCLGVAMDFGGIGVDVSGWFLAGFFGFCLLLVAIPIYCNRSGTDDDYFDERWGAGSIDDDEWGLSIAAARRRSQRVLRELADRDDRRSRNIVPGPGT